MFADSVAHFVDALFAVLAAILSAGIFVGAAMASVAAEFFFLTTAIATTRQKLFIDDTVGAVGADAIDTDLARGAIDVVTELFVLAVAVGTELGGLAKRAAARALGQTFVEVTDFV